MIWKTKTQELKQEHKMCKTNMKLNFYYVNVCNHENNMTKLWCKIMPKVSVEHTKGNEGSYSYLYPFVDLVQGSFYVCIK
jgi:hypothetical protein